MKPEKMYRKGKLAKWLFPRERATFRTLHKGQVTPVSLQKRFPKSRFRDLGCQLFTVEYPQSFGRSCRHSSKML